MPTLLPNLPAKQRDIYETFKQILLGRTNNTGTVTLTENTTTTVITNPNIHAGSKIFYSAETANAAAELANLYTAYASGSATITHSNLASTDRTFGYVFIG